MHYLLKVLIILIFLFKVNPVFAAQAKFITIVNPVRGGDFWELKNTKPLTNVEKSYGVLKEKRLPATWLLRPDALQDTELTTFIKGLPNDQEIGLLMEVTPSWANLAQVKYNQSSNWHFAASVFLTGYSLEDRKKLIDSAFEKFKSSFGVYPKSVGAWWIDGGSLTYMKDKYGITANLDVADQYSTDNYQVWGQYFSTPFLPSKRNALIPALGEEAKIGVVTVQWATRDPFNAYGNGVLDSTYSVQANDYANKKYHSLDIEYFKKLVSVYLDNPYSKIGQVTVGIENDFSWQDYGEEFTKQLEVVADRRRMGTLVLTMSDFAKNYSSRFILSPPEIVFAKDPLGSDGLVVWYQTNRYRIGWFYNKDGSIIRDLRSYVSNQTEPCIDSPCEQINFAMTESRNLDEVTYGDRWVIDEGRITDFKLIPLIDGVEINYTNQASQKRRIYFLPNDIKIDEQPLTIASAIAKITSTDNKSKIKSQFENKLLDPGNVIINQLKLLLKFLVFSFFIFYFPGLAILKKLNLSPPVKFVLAWPVGISLFTLTAFILGYFHFWWGLFVLPIVGLYVVRKDLNLPRLSWVTGNKITLTLITLGSLSWLATTVKNGLTYDFGLGFWGAHGHDAIWHLSVIESAKKGLPLENPIFAGEVLRNYHFFYDLLLAGISNLTNLQAIDLYFRYFPILLSILIGSVVYILANVWFKSKLAANLAIFFIYFGGSFGWIVSYFKNRTLGGESLFWAQQGISTFINPPFAISILLFLTGLFLFNKLVSQKQYPVANIIPLILVWGVLIEFKAYGGLLVLGALSIVTIFELSKRNLNFLKISLPTGLLSLLVFLPNNLNSTSLLVFSPFWLIHSMIESPDRVGWYRLQLAKMAGEQGGNWFKFFAAEIIGFSIFILGNLGTRVVGIAAFKKILPLNSFKLFIGSFLTASSIIPLLFIQKGSSFNIIQFFYYFLVVFSFLAAYSLAILITKNKRIGLLVTAAMVLLTLPTTWDSLHHYIPVRPPSRISTEEVEALNFLKDQENGIVVTFYDKRLRERFTEPVPLFAYDSTAYVSAYSGKREFISDTVNLEILGVDYKGRLQVTRDILAVREPDQINKLLKENNIKYIYAPKVFNFSPDAERLKVKIIFENSEVKIFKVN